METLFSVRNDDLNVFDKSFEDEMDATDEAVVLAEEYPNEWFTVFEGETPTVKISLENGELRYELL